MRNDRAFLSILAVSLLLKGILAILVADLECHGDQCPFLWCARSLLAGEGFSYGPGEWDEGHTPPLYVLFLAACLKVGGGSLTAVRLVQAVLSTLTAAAAGAIALRWTGRRRAMLLATGFTAFFPTYLAYFQWAFAETLFTLELAGLALAAMRLHRTRRWPDALLLGAVLGLTSLTRSVMLLFAAPTALWLLLSPDRRHGGALAAAMIAAQLLVIAPWTAYNQHRFDRLLLLSTNAGNVVHRNLNYTPPENYDYRAQRLTHWFVDREPRRRCREEHPVDRYRCELDGAMQFVREEPGRVLHYAGIKLRALWNPSSFLVRFLADGAYGDLGAGWIRTLSWSAALATMAAALLGTIGFLGGPASPLRSWILLTFLFWHGVHAMALGMSRYRVPLMLLVLVAAAVAAADPSRTWRTMLSRRATWLALPWLVLLILSWAFYLPTLWELPA